MKRWIAALGMVFCLFPPTWAADSSLPVSAPMKAAVGELKRMGIKGDRVQEMTRRLVRNQYHEAEILRVYGKIGEAVSEGVPPQLLSDKVLEATAKGIAEAGLLQAMERIRTRYRTALREASRLAEGEARVRNLARVTFEAMSAGVETGDLKRIRTWLHFRDRELPDAERWDLALQTLRLTRELARLGVSSLEAANMACHALRNRYEALDMVRVRRSFLKESWNTPPELLVSQYATAIRGGMDAETLEKGRSRGPARLVTPPSDSGRAGGPGPGGIRDRGGAQDHGEKRMP